MRVEVSLSRLLAVFGAAAVVLASVAAPAAETRRTLVIAAGEVTGYYFPVAGALCRVINKDKPRGLACAVMPSSGSAANIAALRAGEADLALVQSRAGVLAAAGEEGFRAAGPFPEMKALMALHGEAAVVVARPGSGIEQMADLKGKRVNLGRPGSFQRAMADTAMDAVGLSQGELSPVVELELAEQAAELCQGNIDAAVFTGVHPMPEVAQAIEECGATLVPLRGKSTDAFVKKAPWLTRLTVKAGTYDGQKDDLPALGMRTLLVSSGRLSPDETYDVLKAIYANWGAFTQLHPVLKGLSKADAAKEAVALPRPEAAERFYTETGLK